MSNSRMKRKQKAFARKRLPVVVISPSKFYGKVSERGVLVRFMDALKSVFNLRGAK